MEDLKFANTLEMQEEKELSKVDAFTHRYLQLVQEYGDVPECDVIIIPKLEQEFGKDTVDRLLEDVWNEDDQDNFDDDFPENEEEDEEDRRRQAPLRNEEDKRFEAFEKNSDLAASMLATSVLGWCNMYGLMLSNKDRIIALRILYLLSKALSSLLESFEENLDSTNPRPAVLILRAKRHALLAKNLLHDMEIFDEAIGTTFSGFCRHIEDADKYLSKILAFMRSGSEPPKLY